MRIEIPSVGIDLPVTTGSYDYANQDWTIADGQAFWADLSAPISEEDGNTLIYAHNKSDGFYPLRNIEVGDEIIITAEDRIVLVYQYEYDQIVEPTNNDTFELDDDSYITLLTCNGWFSEVRRLVVGRLVEVR